LLKDEIQVSGFRVQAGKQAHAPSGHTMHKVEGSSATITRLLQALLRPET
jgi:hypothetical protein